ncbi:MAG: site-specific integrase, partial [bacterium]|nr:site-specific integrase [bacterium]
MKELELEIDDYIDYVKYEKKLSNESAKNYRYDLVHFMNYLIKNHITKFKYVNQDVINDYIIF